MHLLSSLSASKVILLRQKAILHRTSKKCGCVCQGTKCSRKCTEVGLWSLARGGKQSVLEMSLVVPSKGELKEDGGFRIIGPQNDFCFWPRWRNRNGINPHPQNNYGTIVLKTLDAGQWRTVIAKWGETWGEPCKWPSLPPWWGFQALVGEGGTQAYRLVTEETGLWRGGSQRCWVKDAEKELQCYAEILPQVFSWVQIREMWGTHKGGEKPTWRIRGNSAHHSHGAGCSIRS